MKINYRLLSLITAFLVISLCTHGFSAKNSKRPANSTNAANSIYNEGLRKFMLSDFKGAESDFARLYEIESSNADNKRMYYKTQVAIGDMEYKNNNLPESRRMYARAVGVVGEDENLLWKLKTIDDSNNTGFIKMLYCIKKIVCSGKHIV